MKRTARTTIWKLKRQVSSSVSLSTLYLSHLNMLNAAGMYISEQTQHICIQKTHTGDTQTHVQKAGESQLPFETF